MFCFIKLMEVNFYNKNLYFNGYQNSKYLNKYTTNSLLNGSTEAHTPPDSLDLNDDAAIYKHSRQEIRGLYKYYGLGTRNLSKTAKKYYKKQIDTIISKLSAGGVNSSNMEMILDLVKDKKLTPEILTSIYKDGKVSRRVNDDLDKLYGAYAEGKSVEDVFVPKFADRNTAIESIEIGDVCQIEGEENISTKLSDGTIEELFITPETYLELFPPVERFVTMQSHSMGDCYLLAALDNIQQNPNARHKILEMFRENPDGTVDVVFGGFENRDGEILQKNPENVILKDVSDAINRNLDLDVTSYTCEGFRAIELLNEEERHVQKKDSIKGRYESFQEMKEQIKNNERVPDSDDIFFNSMFATTPGDIEKKSKEKNAIFKYGQLYTEEELDYFCKYIEDGREDELFLGNLVNRFTKEYLMKKLSELKGKEDEISRYESLIIERYLERLERYDDDKTRIFSEPFPKEVYWDIFNLKKSDTAYNHGGYIAETFEKAGLEIVKDDKDKANYHYLNSKRIKDLLMSDEVNNYVFSIAAGNRNINDDFPIRTNHMYSLAAVDIDGERKFIVRNPHNSMNEVVMTYGELCRHFTFICAAKIED